MVPLEAEVVIEFEDVITEVVDSAIETVFALELDNVDIKVDELKDAVDEADDELSVDE